MSNALPARKILVLAANPKGTDKLRLDEEVRDIKEGLRQSKERDRFTIDAEWAIRPRDIRRTILNAKPQIVHFSGHGEEDGGLAFENDIGQVQLLQPAALAGLFKLFSEYIECVILNACYSEIQADAIAQHIDFVIGMNKEIGDQAAIEFAVGFYDALGAGYSVETAYEFGRNAIHMVNVSEILTPVLKCRDSDQKAQNAATSNNIKSKESTTTRSVEFEAPPKTVYEFVLTGSVDEVSKQKLEAIVIHLQEITGDTSLTLLKVDSGSIRLILEGSEEGFQLLQSLFNSGMLNEVEGLFVEKISLQDNDFERQEQKKNNDETTTASVLRENDDTFQEVFRTPGGVSIIVVKPLGRLDITTAWQFRLKLQECITQVSPHIVVDLSLVNFMDSSGLTSLVAGMRDADKRNGSFKLCGVHSDVETVLEVTMMDSVFEIFDTREEAVGIIMRTIARF